MIRTIRGLVAANVAAPYLTVFFIFALDWLLATNAGQKSRFDIDFVGAIGTFALVALGLPLLLLSAALDLILAILNWRSPWQVVASGAALGLSFMVFLFFRSFHQSWDLLLSGACSGAICGWIYWRIAIRRTSGSSRAIDAG